MNEAKPLKLRTANLASTDKLTDNLGKGFDATNLRNMRCFYPAFPIQETVSPQLGG